MPITLVHLGILAPLNHFFPKKVNALSFLLVNLWIDAGAIAYVGFNTYWGPLHGPESHSFLASLAISSIVGVVGMLWYVLQEIRYPGTCPTSAILGWYTGAFLGGTSHILLDMLVHSEMQPLAPWVDSNPFYCDAMVPLSAVLVVPTAWFILQLVSDKAVAPGRT